MDNRASIKKDQSELSQEMFDSFLEWLIAEREQAGQEYERIRQALLIFFRRSGGHTVAEDLVDRTVDRTAKLIWVSPTDETNAAEHSHSNRLSYLKKVARYIYLEYLNSASAKKTAALSDKELAEAYSLMELRAFNEEQNRRHEKLMQEYEHLCLEECEEHLPPAHRRLFKVYYQGLLDRSADVEVVERSNIDVRRDLARQLNLSANTLRVRVHRIRDNLDACVIECVEQKLEKETNLKQGVI